MLLRKLFSTRRALTRGALVRSGLAVAVVLPVIALTGGSSASALAWPPYVPVSLNGTSGPVIGGPAVRQAGRVTFQVSTTTQGGDEFDLLKIRGRGVTLQQVAAAWQRLFSSQGPDVADIRWLEANVTFFGGAIVDPVRPVWITETLYPGTYYAWSDSQVPSATWLASIRTIRVVGPVTATIAPPANATVHLVDHSFVSPPVLPAHGAVLVRNDSDELHFMEMQPVKPGITDADVTNLLNQIMNGQQPSSDPGNGPSLGMSPISPGVQVLVSYWVDPGNINFACFIPDDMTGTPHAFMGMHKIVSFQ